jgi:hypothetical protein
LLYSTYQNKDLNLPLPDLALKKKGEPENLGIRYIPYFKSLTQKPYTFEKVLA